MELLSGSVWIRSKFPSGWTWVVLRHDSRGFFNWLRNCGFNRRLHFTSEKFHSSLLSSSFFLKTKKKNSTRWLPFPPWKKNINIVPGGGIDEARSEGLRVLSLLCGFEWIPTGCTRRVFEWIPTGCTRRRVFKWIPTGSTRKGYTGQEGRSGLRGIELFKTWWYKNIERDRALGNPRSYHLRERSILHSQPHMEYSTFSADVQYNCIAKWYSTRLLLQ